MRKYAREVAFSLVFEYMFTKAFNEMELEQFDKNNLTDEDLDFIKKLYKGVVGEYSDLENRVGELSKGFKIDRVFKVDKAVLMMAIFELDNLDTPKSVVINEAVELAKKYAGEEDASFINGVLGSFVRGEVEPQAEAEEASAQAPADEPEQRPENGAEA